MTTIAIRDGIIAYDSRLSRGTLIVDDNHDKKRIVGDLIFFCYGNLTGGTRLIDAYVNNVVNLPIEASAVLVEKGVAYHVGYDLDADPEHIWKSEITWYEAFGTGDFFAITAMDMGCSAYDAVKMAAKRDALTNDNVRTYRLPKRNKNE